MRLVCLDTFAPDRYTVGEEYELLRALPPGTWEIQDNGHQRRAVTPMEPVQLQDLTPGARMVDYALKGYFEVLPQRPKCIRCQLFGWPKDYNQEPKCAFSGGTFDTDNWACRTAITLRWLVERKGEVTYGDDGQIGVLYSQELGKFLLLGWYKSRGQQAFATLIGYDGTQELLQLAAAEKILEEHRDEATGGRFA